MARRNLIPAFSIQKRVGRVPVDDLTEGLKATLRERLTAPLTFYDVFSIGLQINAFGKTKTPTRCEMIEASRIRRVLVKAETNDPEMLIFNAEPLSVDRGSQQSFDNPKRSILEWRPQKRTFDHSVKTQPKSFLRIRESFGEPTRANVIYATFGDQYADWVLNRTEIPPLSHNTSLMFEEFKIHVVVPNQRPADRALLFGAEFQLPRHRKYRTIQTSAKGNIWIQLVPRPVQLTL